MNDLKNELDNLTSKVKDVSVIKKYIVGDDLERLELRLNKRIDGVKKDLMLFFGIITFFLGVFVTLIVKFVR